MAEKEGVDAPVLGRGGRLGAGGASRGEWE